MAVYLEQDALRLEPIYHSALSGSKVGFSNWNILHSGMEKEAQIHYIIWSPLFTCFPKTYMIIQQTRKRIQN